MILPIKTPQLRPAVYNFARLSLLALLTFVARRGQGHTNQIATSRDMLVAVTDDKTCILWRNSAASMISRGRLLKLSLEVPDERRTEEGRSTGILANHCAIDPLHFALFILVVVHHFRRRLLFHPLYPPLVQPRFRLSQKPGQGTKDGHCTKDNTATQWKIS